MDDETLTPFVDALSASLIIMVLVSISFIIQSALSITDSAKNYVDKRVEEEDSSPISYNKPVEFDPENNRITYMVNFELSEQQIKALREDIKGQSTLKLIVETRDSDKKAAANLLRLLIALNLPKEVRTITEIRPSQSSLSKLHWSH